MSPARHIIPPTRRARDAMVVDVPALALCDDMDQSSGPGITALPSAYAARQENAHR
jgi:hypothetical protein